MVHLFAFIEIFGKRLAHFDIAKFSTCSRATRRSSFNELIFGKKQLSSKSTLIFLNSYMLEVVFEICLMTSSLERGLLLASIGDSSISYRKCKFLYKSRLLPEEISIDIGLFFLMVTLQLSAIFLCSPLYEFFASVERAFEDILKILSFDIDISLHPADIVTVCPVEQFLLYCFYYP